MSDLFDYKKEMSALHFTEEQKHRLARAAALAARSQKRRRPLGRIALLAAVMAVVLAVGTSAAGVLPAPIDVFAPLFGGAVAQTEVIDKIGHPIGASDSDGGITITADAIMGDEYNAVIVYTLSRDDGARFLPEGLDSTMLLMGGFSGSSWVQGGTHGSSWFVDEDPEDDRIQLVETASSDRSMTKGTATAEFQDLCYWDAETKTSQPLYEGHWKFRFHVDYEDCALHLGSGETFSQDGLTFTIDEITVSPLAVRAAYTADAQPQWTNAESGQLPPEDARQSDLFLQNVEILLTKTDGSVIDLSGSGGSIHPENGRSLCTKGRVLDEITPLDTIASISVGGIVFEIR